MLRTPNLNPKHTKTSNRRMSWYYQRIRRGGVESLTSAQELLSSDKAIVIRSLVLLIFCRSTSKSARHLLTKKEESRKLGTFIFWVSK
jgi:hypothetical protein